VTGHLRPHSFDVFGDEDEGVGLVVFAREGVKKCEVAELGDGAFAGAGRESGAGGEEGQRSAGDGSAVGDGEEGEIELGGVGGELLDGGFWQHGFSPPGGLV
jgi:hypothetical protein